MVSASCVRETALADTDMLVSEANRSDGRRDRKAGCVVRVASVEREFR